MHIERADSTNFTVTLMPDGSRILRSTDNSTVLALNSVAAAAWDACASSCTVAEVGERMRQCFDPSVTDELAEASLLQLQDKKLVTLSGLGLKATRREVLAGLGAVALPLVVSLSVGEQQAHASAANSANTRFDHEPHATSPKGHNKPSF